MNHIERFRTLVKEIKIYQYVMNVIGWDSETEAPRGAFAARADVMGAIGGEIFRRSTSPEYREIVDALYHDIDKLDPATAKEIRRAKKALDKIVRVPEDEFVAYQRLLTLAQPAWEDAKAKNDWNAFKPFLADIVAANRRFVGYYGIPGEPYDVLLDEFEEGMSMAAYDRFFAVLKRDLVPFVKQVLAAAKGRVDPIAGRKFPVEGQQKFSRHLLDVMKFDTNRGLLKKSVHPFTWNTSPADVRLTTRYDENDVFGSIFSTIHELGHATYEQQIDPVWDPTLLASGTTMGIHESQSRMYENVFGRSEPFWEKHLPALRRRFPTQLGDVGVADFVRAANKVEASFIRTEADELTYPLHIMVRYDIERMLFSGKLGVDELPAKWNELMKSYLGIVPPTDTLGVLQDVHWSSGLFGYFPTYALGTAYAAQIYDAMRKELDVDAILRSGDMGPINAWLKEKIHRFGGSKSPEEIMLDVTGAPFDPSHYVDYLKRKYTLLYLS
ncbi:MAG: carboxypeptidase M32 [Candidatus Izemoplasmatales bacterium]